MKIGWSPISSVADDSMSVFFYGTLRSAYIRDRVFGLRASQLVIRPAIVAGFDLLNVVGKQYPQLCRSENAEARVEGILIQNTCCCDLELLDRFEGKKYSRYKIFVFDKFEKAKIQTESYLPNVELESDKKWEFETWEKECLKTFMRDDFNIDGVT